MKNSALSWPIRSLFQRQIRATATLWYGELCRLTQAQNIVVVVVSFFLANTEATQKLAYTAANSANSSVLLVLVYLGPEMSDYSFNMWRMKKRDEELLIVPLDLAGESDWGKGKIWSLRMPRAGSLLAPAAQSASQTGTLLLCTPPKKGKRHYLPKYWTTVFKLVTHRPHGIHTTSFLGSHFFLSGGQKKYCSPLFLKYFYREKERKGLWTVMHAAFRLHGEVLRWSICPTEHEAHCVKASQFPYCDHHLITQWTFQ